MQQQQQRPLGDVDIKRLLRDEHGRVVAAAARITRDLAAAEDCAQDALLKALETWTRDGVPTNAGAWLTTAAKNRALDMVRARRRRESKASAAAAESAAVDNSGAVADAAAVVVGGAGGGGGDDEQLRLFFMCCHGSLSPESQIALTLRLVGGLTTAEIARALHVDETAVAQRLVRAKKSLARTRASFDAPTAEEIAERLPQVLEVIYAIFNEGYAATAGDAVVRTDLVDDALRLGRRVAALAPRHADTYGLIALMELQASRSAARMSSDGTRGLTIEEQDRALWDRRRIARGISALEDALRLAGGAATGSYTLQAALAAEHARAPSFRETRFDVITALYDRMLELWPSPVVALNRAVAVSYAVSPERALPLVDELARALDGFHLFHATRADILARMGRNDDARRAYAKALKLTTNNAERALFEKKRAALG